MNTENCGTIESQGNEEDEESLGSEQGGGGRGTPRPSVLEETDVSHTGSSLGYAIGRLSSNLEVYDESLQKSTI